MKMLQVISEKKAQRKFKKIDVLEETKEQSDEEDLDAEEAAFKDRDSFDFKYY